MAPLQRPSSSVSGVPSNSGVSFTLADSTPFGSGQQNTQQQNNPPPSQGSSLFGGAATNTTSQAPTGGLFGSTQPQQQQGNMSSGFGSSLFGNTTNNATQQQPAPATSLFANLGNNNTTQQQPAPATSLFANLGNNNTQQQQPASTGLFQNLGNNNATQQQTQPTTSLFQNLGNNNATQQQTQPTTSLFANLGNNSTQTQQPAPTGLFGSTTTQQPASNTTPSLFASLGSQNKPTTSLFGSSTTATQPTQQQNNSFFGLSAVPPNALSHSLLSASHAHSMQNPAPFAGKLSMGQSFANPPAQTAPLQGAVRVHADDLRGTTRFADCVDEVKSKFEEVDGMIQKQERFCREIQALLGKHEADISCLAPSVTLITEKADGVEAVLASDAQAVNRARKVLAGDKRDLARAQRVAENLMLPAGLAYQVPSGYGTALSMYGRQVPSGSTGAVGEEEYDTDLVGNYFIPLTSTLSKQLEAYEGNLTEIEAHLRVIEASAVSQAQTLARRRAGVGGSAGSGGSDDTVRELADTLTGFEQSLLGVAGVVGECREGVDGLVLGRLGQKVGGGSRRW